MGLFWPKKPKHVHVFLHWRTTKHNFFGNIGIYGHLPLLEVQNKNFKICSDTQDTKLEKNVYNFSVTKT